MRCLPCLLLIACGNDVDPRVIPGGGISDGEIDGEANIYVIDDATDLPLSGATVEIGTKDKTTDVKGLVTFSDLTGPQTIAVKATGYRSDVLIGANGANITFSLKKLDAVAAQATLSGSITGYGAITAAAQHIKAGIALYSQTDDLGDPANNLKTPNNGPLCLSQTDCNWTLVSRTGTVTVLDMIVDRDSMGTLAEADDVQIVTNYAYATTTVVGGVNQNGIAMSLIEAGNLQNVTIDLGTPPAALTETGAIVGLDVADDEVIQIPTFFVTDKTKLLIPKPTVFSATGTLRLTAIAQTTMGDAGAQSFILIHDLKTTNLFAGSWLDTPTSVTATRTTASFAPVLGAKLHTVTWSDATNELLQITVVDGKTTSVSVPPLVALPTSGTLTAKVTALAADINLNDFEGDRDSDKINAVSAQPVNVP